MPHITLEYSDNLKESAPFDELFTDLHQVLVVAASAELGRCQSRAIEHQHFYIGDGNSHNAFIHVDVLLAEGRALEVRQEVGKQFLRILEEYFSRSLKDLNLQISVEVREFLKNLYFKKS